MITLGALREMLGWCSIINLAILLWWFFAFTFVHDFVYRLHSKWFKISKEKFDAIHYSGIAFYKIIVLVFNVVPYIALRILS